MAKADFKLPDEFLTKLSRLGKDTDSVAEKVLEAGGQVVLARVRSNLAAVIGSGTKYDSRSTGELAQSLGLSPVKPFLKPAKSASKAECIRVMEQTLKEEVEKL